jgi:hypothetical protein
VSLGSSFEAGLYFSRLSRLTRLRDFKSNGVNTLISSLVRIRRLRPDNNSMPRVNLVLATPGETLLKTSYRHAKLPPELLFQTEQYKLPTEESAWIMDVERSGGLHD